MNYQSVLRTINSIDPDTAYLVVADQNGKQQTIVSDSKHPYFAQYGTDPTPPQPSPGKPYHGNIANAYWVNAANLEAGHKLIDDSGNWQTVVSVRVEPKPSSPTPSTPSSHRLTPRSPPRRDMTTGAKYKTRSGSKPPNCNKATACWVTTNAGTPCTASASRKNRSKPTT